MSTSFLGGCGVNAPVVKWPRRQDWEPASAGAGVFWLPANRVPRIRLDPQRLTTHVLLFLRPAAPRIQTLGFAGGRLFTESQRSFQVKSGPISPAEYREIGHA
jgi:hypothetical protein